VQVALTINYTYKAFQVTELMHTVTTQSDSSCTPQFTIQ